MNDDLFKILEFLSEVPVGTKRDVSEKLNQLFPKEIPQTDGNMSYFLNSLSPYTNYTENNFRREKNFGFVGFELRLNNDGVAELKKEEKLRLEIDGHKSTIDVNKSIVETNKTVRDMGTSVVDTNTAMVNISTRQTVINEKIANNSKAQTEILKSQRYILWASVFVAACSAFISYLSYRKDAPSNQSKQELKVINKRIDTLMQRLPQTKNIPPIKMETKDSTKKKN